MAKLFDDIISRITKSMGGGKKGTDSQVDKTTEDEDEDEEDEEGEEVVEATEIIKALTERVEGLQTGQAELLKAIQQDAEFKKSLGEGMIALMQGYEAIAKTPLPRMGIGPLDAAGLSKGGLGGAPATSAKRHRQFTPEDKDHAMDVLTKAVADKELSLVDCSKMETQINKSIRDPYFQLEPRYVAFLEKKLGSN